MLVIMLRAFLGANLAGADAGFDLSAQHLDVAACPPHREPGCRAAHVGAVETGADALRHVHRLSDAGISTARAHQ